MENNLAAEIAATFRRIHRPLQWPMAKFARKRIANRSFVGVRFSRVRGRANAGFCFGFALRDGAIPGVREPPEIVAYAFARPVSSGLHRRLTARADSAGRRLVASSRRVGFPFEFFPKEETIAVRHRSMARVPPEIFILVASDFLMLSYAPLRASRFLERVTRATSGPG